MTAVWIFFAVLFAALATLMLVAGLRLTAPRQTHASAVERSDIADASEAVDTPDPQT